MTKFIVVCGGVISGVGKGVATASIGRLMKEYGFSVTAIKIDPYINCDAGTIRPTEHGEVWVTDDGGEIDQDLGNYERFLEQAVPKKNNITTGQVYKKLIEQERRGDFLGETVEVIPHVPEEIKRRILDAGKDYDIALIEIGGTVGEYQNNLFMFALRSLENDIGKDNICYLLVSYLPVPSHIEEMKTKPTQLSVSLLRTSGIEPDFIICRGRHSLDSVRKKKLERNINIRAEHIISMPDVIGPGTANSLYVIPLDLDREGLGQKILDILHLKKRKEMDLTEWTNAVRRMTNPSGIVNIGMVGKYLDIGDYKLVDSYISVNESLKHACAKHDVRLNLVWIDSKKLEKNDDGTDVDVADELKDFDGIIVPGGFGSSGVEGKINAIRYCRENDVPFLGLCYGLQLAVVEYARDVCKLKDAHTTEVAPETSSPVIDILPEQKHISSKGATMRLGAYDALLTKGTLVHEIYGVEKVSERHRHRYEVNPEYHEILQKFGLIFSGMSPDSRLVEFIELPRHKYFVATQAHPEFKSSLLKPAPLFDAFIKASIKK
ncbi:MAG: glutamine hydrolyzing CTP synthase [Candidatus Woesearchaeota archaeon]